MSCTSIFEPCMSRADTFLTRAFPVSVTSTCGHSFCSECIVKWYLIHLRPAENYHYFRTVLCPLCRTEIRTSSLTVAPRSRLTTPFAPNRTAASMLDFLVGIVNGVTDHWSNDERPPAINVDDPLWEWKQGGVQYECWRDRTR